MISSKKSKKNETDRFRMEGWEKLRKGFGLTNKKDLLSQVLFLASDAPPAGTPTGGQIRQTAYPLTEPPQYSQQPLASGMVVAPQQGHVTAVLGAAAEAASRRTCWRACVSARWMSLPSFWYS